MPSRRKLIEQVIGKIAFSATRTISAGSTGAVTGAAVDRKGYLSAYVFAKTDGTAGSTTDITFRIYDSSDNSTYAIYDSANCTVTVGVSADYTSGGFNCDLAGANRYIKVYAESTTAVDETATITATVILGDRTAVAEPAT